MLGGRFVTLDELELNTPAVITEVGGEGELRLRLLDMGLIPRTTVKIKKVAPKRQLPPTVRKNES